MDEIRQLREKTINRIKLDVLVIYLISIIRH